MSVRVLTFLHSFETGGVERLLSVEAGDARKPNRTVPHQQPKQPAIVGNGLNGIAQN